MIFRLHNTLTRRIEAFSPRDPAGITFYTCGPTVYDDAHIGNFRSFLAADLLRRWLESPLCTLQRPDGGTHDGPRRVLHVMNVTDVGHMTEDDDADGSGEDKMVAAAKRIVEAKKSGKLPTDAAVDPNDPGAVARFYLARFLEDARALNLKVAHEAEADPTLMPRATDHVDAMRRVIARLLDDGAAYAAGEPGARAVYFSVQAFPEYGKLSGNTLDKLRGGAGGRVDDATQREKRHPADFLLWKEDPAHKMKWDAPDHPALQGWAKGYPGWHIECTAMALERLVDGGLAHAQGAQIDLHSGGEDNIFPHHECEIAQSCAFTGAPGFARHWFHPRFLMVDGKKMSKSRGTFFTPRDLMAQGHDPAAIRLELIKTHYRANADFSVQGLKDSAKRIKNWRAAARRLMACIEIASSDPSSYVGWSYDGYRLLEDRADGAAETFSKALHADLNIAKAISFMDRIGTSATLQPPVVGAGGQTTKKMLEAKFYAWEHKLSATINRTELPNRPCDANEQYNILCDSSRSDNVRTLAAIHIIDNILGVVFRPPVKSHDTGIAVYRPGVEPSDEVESLLAERRDARKSKDFARSDAIRDQLASMGYAIKDMPEGRVEVSRHR